MSNWKGYNFVRIDNIRFDKQKREININEKHLN